MAAASRFNVTMPGGGVSAPLSDLRVGFRAGYAIEVIDTRTGDIKPFGVHVFPMNPRQYTLSEPFAVNLTPTEGDSVSAEENGQIIREITIEGTFGWTKKTSPTFYASQGASIGGETLSGNEHFIALRNLFRRYSTWKKDPEQGPFTQMIFHSLKDDDHFIVAPRSFETPRDSRSLRVTYSYRITMAAIGESERRISLADDTRGEWMQSISTALNDARSAFAELAADLSEIKRRVANFQAVLIQAGAVISAVSNFVKNGASLIEFSYQQAINVIDTVGAAADELADAGIDVTFGVASRGVQNLHRLETSIDRICQWPDRFSDGDAEFQAVKRRYLGERAMTPDDIENRTAGATVATAVRVARGSAAVEGGITLPSFDGVLKVRVSRADSIEGLATRYRVSPEMIILVNRLRFPYITDGGGPGILSPGDEILIPVTRTTPGATSASTRTAVSPDEALYGRDIALDPEVLRVENRFEWMIDEAHGSQSEATVSGLPNVVQGTQISIGIERGACAYIPDLGIRRSAGEKGTLQSVLLASLNLRAAMLSDPRIERIDSVRVVLDGDVLTQEITPVIKGSKDSAVIAVAFGSVGG